MKLNLRIIPRNATRTGLTGAGVVRVTHETTGGSVTLELVRVSSGRVEREILVLRPDEVSAIAQLLRA